MKRNPDTSESVALVALAAAAGYAIYKVVTKEDAPIVPPGDWAPTANVELDRRMFQVIIKPPVVGDWIPANTELDVRDFNIDIKEPIIGDWMSANIELDSRTFSVNIVSKPSMAISITNVPAGLGITYWWMTINIGTATIYPVEHLPLATAFTMSFTGEFSGISSLIRVQVYNFNDEFVDSRSFYDIPITAGKDYVINFSNETIQEV